MDEKPKRGEKSKSKSKRGENAKPFAFVALFLLVLFLLGIVLTFFFQMQPSKEQLAFELTRDAIQTQNVIASTQIAASATAAVNDATTTKAAQSTASLEAALNATASFIETENIIRSTEIAGTVTQAYLIPIATQTAEIRKIQTATASVMMNQAPSSVPPTVACGYIYYNGLVEVVPDSLAWQAALTNARVPYQYAQVNYDVWEAQICGELISPLPYRCLSMEIALDISPADWGNIEKLVAQLNPILETIEETGLCNEANAELQVYFFADDDLHYWWAERDRILEAYQNGASPETLWALGTVGDRR